MNNSQWFKNNNKLTEHININLLRIDVTGTWVTGWNESPVKMYLKQEDNLITGTYEFNDGKLIGILDGSVAVGSWIQNNSLGNFKLIFSPDGSSFQGTWGYNKEISGGGTWYGRRLVIGNLDVTGTWDTNYNKMYLEQKSNRVVGRYDYNNGRIEGLIKENTMEGTWYEDNNNDGKYETIGKLRFIFGIDNTYKGNRGSNESYTNEGAWNGRKISTPNENLKPLITCDVTGIWNTNFNKMSLQQTGYNVSGNFDYNKGKIIGVIYGDTMTGSWYQDVNNDGTYETTGKLIFKFSSEENSFKGSWGYLESFSDGGLWNGAK